MNKIFSALTSNGVKKNNQKIGILGYGEVGRAIAKFYHTPKIKDLKRDDGLIGVDILNVCIPWSKKFPGIAEKEIKRIKPRLTIIHSTIAPGTTKKLSKKFSGRVVHSPIRGVHPNLYEGIKTFIKYIGADDKKAGNMAKKHLESLGIKTRVFYPSLTTEIGKILDTSYYGVIIAWHGEMKEICDKFNVDFKKSVTDFNKTYNDGYLKLKMNNVVRPVLYPPPNNIIGGHCIVENAEILKSYCKKGPAIDLVLKYKKKK